MLGESAALAGLIVAVSAHVVITGEELMIAPARFQFIQNIALNSRAIEIAEFVQVTDADLKLIGNCRMAQSGWRQGEASELLIDVAAACALADRERIGEAMRDESGQGRGFADAAFAFPAIDAVLGHVSIATERVPIGVGIDLAERSLEPELLVILPICLAHRSAALIVGVGRIDDETRARADVPAKRRCDAVLLG